MHNTVVNKAKACKHCGFKVCFDEPDFLYPSNWTKTEYSANCYETGGGCGHFEVAATADAVLELWNAELKAGEKPNYP